MTCRKLEQLSKIAVEEGEFQKRVQAGTLRFEVVDVDRPENRHFVSDFGLYTQSLVLVERQGGKTVRFKNLPRIWELASNSTAYVDYVRQELSAFLKDR